MKMANFRLICASGNVPGPRELSDEPVGDADAEAIVTLLEGIVKVS
jgi:hypothetical protein